MLCMHVLQGFQLLRMLVGRLAEKSLQVVQALFHRAVLLLAVGELLHVPVVGLLQGLQLLGVPVRRVPQPLLQVGQALRQGRVVCGLRLQAGHLLDKLGMRVLERPELIHVPVRRVARDLLEVVHALLQRRVLHRCARILLGELEEVGGVLPVRRPQRRQLAGVLVHGVVKRPLEKADTVRQGGMLAMRRLERLELLRQPALRGGVLAVRLLEGVQLPRMLLGRIAQQLLEVLEALLQGRMLELGGLERLQVFPMPSLGGGMLGMRFSEGLHFLSVPLGGVPQQLLQVADALRDTVVLLLARPHGLQVLRQPRVRGGVLGVGVLQGLELPGVGVGGAAQLLLQLLQALGEGGVVGEPRQVLGVLLQHRPQRLHLPRMLAAVVAHELLGGAQPLVQGGVAHAHGLLEGFQVPRVLAVGRVMLGMTSLDALQLPGMPVRRV
mmetsp:Transcript_955/g.3381  ORF Transcript_955/g.3381 Transcript_955/m.3381 type:complete len:439 (-) Transcript_955:668-1984(-)